MVISQKRHLRVFLCHAKADKPAVRGLYNRLLSNDVETWLDEENLMPGQDWQKEIQKAVRNSDIVFVCLSKNSINKDGFIQKEIKFALDVADEKAEGTVYIIPVRLEECDVPERFSKYHWADLFELKGYDRLLRTLISKAEQLDVLVPGKRDEIFSIPKPIDDVLDEYPAKFREEHLDALFSFIRRGESFFIIGAPNVGKSRLIELVIGENSRAIQIVAGTESESLKNRYLGKEISSHTWITFINMNALGQGPEWGFLFYEQLIHSLLLVSNKMISSEEDEHLKEMLASLDAQVITSKDGLMAYRLFELAVSALCHQYGRKICFIFDEFDSTYKTMPREILSQLRAIRDANKYMICYGLVLKNLPEVLRDPEENEAFYELISRNMIGLGPYSIADTLYMVRNLERRKNLKLSDDVLRWIYVTSGGHPGLVHVLFLAFDEDHLPLEHLESLEWFINRESIKNELRRICAGLTSNELNGLLAFANGNQIWVQPLTIKLLLAKGLLQRRDRQIEVFSPLLEQYLKMGFLHLSP